MTYKQRENMRLRLAAKYRRMASDLLFIDMPRVHDETTERLIKAAHDNLCKAFTRLDEIGGAL